MFPKVVRSLAFICVGLGFISTGCTQFDNSTLSSAGNEDPGHFYNLLTEFTPPASDDDFKGYSVRYDGSGGSSSQIYTHFGYDGNGDHWGDFSYYYNQFSLRRHDVTGPCNGLSGIAPNCAFTWGGGSTGMYKGYNINTFFNTPHNKIKWTSLRSVSAEIRMDLVSGNLAGGFSACGLNLGLGDGVSAHAVVPDLPTSLDIANRGAKGDMILFSYHILDGGWDMLRIETPLNLATDSSFLTDARWDTSLNMTEDAPLIANGDSVTFQMKIKFDHVNEVATLTMTPISSTTDTSLMHTQTVTWHYFSPNNYSEDGEVRAGIDVTETGSLLPLSKDDVKNSYVTVGAHQNGITKMCSFSNIIVNTD